MVISTIRAEASPNPLMTAGLSECCKQHKTEGSAGRQSESVNAYAARVYAGYLLGIKMRPAIEKEEVITNNANL